MRTRARSRQAAEGFRQRRRAQVEGGEGGGAAFYVEPVGSEPGELSAPDLLHAEPRPWGDLAGATELVRFAFEGGDCEGVFDAVVEATPVCPTTFKPESFQEQLFFDDLLGAGFVVQAEGKSYQPSRRLLTRLFSSPPGLTDARARQLALTELIEEPPLRAALERLYGSLRRTRLALEIGPSTEPSAVRRKLEVLAGVRDCIEAMAEGFGAARSPLGRIAQLGRELHESNTYRQLTELLDFDNHLATVDLRVRFGADGTVRGLGILAVRENEENALIPGPVKRFFQRLLSLLRGYRYGETELMVRLLHSVFEPLVEGVVACLALTGSIEFYLAALGFRDHAQKHGLSTCLPELVDAPPLSAPAATDRLIEGLFNPLLFLQGVTPVASDLPIRDHDAVVVVTGPNSGGKTRFLQALALAQCLGQVGAFVPAKRARLVWAPNLFVSLVTQADASQVEGRLGTELLRIRRLFEEICPSSLVVLDELCSGTNPQEGEAIFELVLSLLPRLRPQVFISTHFLGLAARLERERPIDKLGFLEVELNADERPTYSFVPGVARTSLAHRVAERLGVTRGELEALVAAKENSQAS